jgi:hypothetical protein
VKSVISFMLLLPFFVFFMFQPFFNEVTHLRGMALEITLNRGIQQAAVQGYFTTDIINKMKDDLGKAGFNSAYVEFSGTTTRVDRGQYLQGQLKYPMNNLWVMPGMLGSDGTSNYYIRSATQMSEYLNR